MKRRAVILDPGARQDLDNLYDWIADSASPRIASAYLDRVADFLSRLDLAAERGTAHDDIAPGLRTVGFERRLTIALQVTEMDVPVVGIFRAGRDWASALGDR